MSAVPAPRFGVIGLSTLVGMLLLSTPVAGASNEGIAWKRCGENLECANVRVPLDWARPNGSRIRLAVIRHLASRPDERIGSLFFNPGGPGGSADVVRTDGDNLDAAGDGRFDVVGWDIRGAGDSTRIRCFRSEWQRAAFFRNWSLSQNRSRFTSLRAQDRGTRAALR